MKEFGDIESFVKHLQTVAVVEQVAARKGLQKAAKIVEKEAKASIGTYQDQIGDFIAWPELADATKADRVRKGFTEDDPGLRTGEMRDSIGTAISTDGLEAQIGSDDDKLVWFELGTIKQPPRSVLGGAVARKIPEIREAIARDWIGALVGEEVHEGKMMIEGDDV